MLDLILELQTVLIFVVAFFVAFAYIRARPPRKNYPPGPPMTPCLGNLKYVTGNTKMHETLDKLGHEYGPIFSLQLGWYPHVVLTDYNLIKEALVDNGSHFSNRFNYLPYMKMSSYRTKGIVLNNGEYWRASRRFTISSLRDFGFGKDTIEQRILAETDLVLQEVASHKGEPFEFDILFNKAALNVICSMIFGKRFDYRDRDFIDLLMCINAFVSKGMLQIGSAYFLPYALPLVFLNPAVYKTFKTYDIMGIFVKKQIQEYRQNFDNNKIRDFVDLFIEAEQKDSGDELYSEPNLFKIILDLMLTGSESTSTTLLWAMLFMLQHPEVQDKCRQEIMQVLGPDQKPTLKDRDKLPYIEAVICETQRLGNIVPTVQHAVVGDVEFHGYTLPDKTVVTPHYYSVHMDPKLWNNPEQFKPERFLDESNKVVRPPYFMPFGIGKRYCLAENLAKSALFLFFTTLIQNYRFTCQDRQKLPTIHDSRMGFTLFPGQYEVMASPLKISQTTGFKKQIY